MLDQRMGEYIRVPYTRLGRGDKYDLAYDRYQSLTPSSAQNYIKDRFYYCSVLSHIYWSNYDFHSAHKTLSLDRRATSKIRTKLPEYFITKEAHEEYFHRKSESCKAGEERWKITNI